MILHPFFKFTFNIGTTITSFLSHTDVCQLTLVSFIAVVGETVVSAVDQTQLASETGRAYGKPSVTKYGSDTITVQNVA